MSNKSFEAEINRTLPSPQPWSQLRNWLTGLCPNPTQRHASVLNSLRPSSNVEFYICDRHLDFSLWYFDFSGSGSIILLWSTTHNMPQIFLLSTLRCPLRFRNWTLHTKVINARQTSTFFICKARTTDSFVSRHFFVLFWLFFLRMVFMEILAHCG